MKAMPSVSVWGCVLVGATSLVGCVSEGADAQDVSSNDGEFLDGTAEEQLVVERGSVIETGIVPVESNLRDTLPTTIEVNGIVIDAPRSLLTTELGGSTSLGIRLARAPRARVVVKLISQDLTEGEFLQSTLTFTTSNWSVFQRAQLRGVKDLILDGSVRYGIALKTSSIDSYYSGKTLEGIATNLDGAVFHGLGGLSGGSVQSIVNDVSANGNTVVGNGFDVSGARAFRWRPDGGMIALDGSGGSALGVSPNGSIITGAVAAIANAPNLAAVWLDGTLSPLPAGTVSGTCGPVSTPLGVWPESGNAVTDSGIVVGSLLECGTGKHRGFLWNGTMRIDSPSVLSSVRSDGASSVGTTTLPKMYSFGVLYGADPSQPGSRLQHPDQVLCPTINPICQTEPSEMSYDGQTIVGSATVPSSTYFGIPTVWTVDGSGHALPKHPAEAQRCQALGVNGAATAGSTVIVGTCTTNADERAVVWVNGVAQTVEAALLREGVTVPSGWKLLSAKAASSDGRVIVGNGRNPDGGTEAFRVVLPGLLNPQ